MTRTIADILIKELITTRSLIGWRLSVKPLAYNEPSSTIRCETALHRSCCRINSSAADQDCHVLCSHCVVGYVDRYVPLRAYTAVTHHTLSYPPGPLNRDKFLRTVFWSATYGYVNDQHVRPRAGLYRGGDLNSIATSEYRPAVVRGKHLFIAAVAGRSKRNKALRA